MRKNVFKIIAFLILLTIVFASFYQAFAAERQISEWSDFKQFDDKNIDGNLEHAVRHPLSVILSLSRIIAVIIAICMILWSAIRYMLPNFTLFGKALDQAEVKRDIPRMVGGSLILFGTSGLLTLIQYIIDDTIGGIS